MRIVVNYRLLIVSALALVLVGGYVFWAKPFPPPTSDLEVRAELIWKQEIRRDRVAHLEFSPDGKLLAFRDDDEYKDEEGLMRSTEGEGSITLVDVATLLPLEEKVVFTVPDEGWFGHDFQFTADGLLAAKSNGEICFYDVDSREVRKRIPDPGGSTLTISPKGDAIAFFEEQKEGVPQYSLQIRSIDTTETIDAFLSIDCAPVYSGPAVFSSCGRYVACQGRNSTQVGDMRTRTRLREWKHPTAEHVRNRLGRTQLSFSFDSRYLAAVRDKDGIRVWDKSTGRTTPVRIDWRDAGYAKVIAFSPDGRLIASAGTDSTAREENSNWQLPRGGTVKLSDAKTGALLWSQDLFEYPDAPLRGWPRALAFSPDGNLLAVALGNLGSARVTLWKIAVKEKAEE